MIKTFTLSMSLLFVATPTFADDLCEPLAPKGGDEITESFKGAIEGEVEGIISKLAGGSASINGEYLRLEKDTLKDYPEAAKVFAWQSIVYLACVKPEVGIDVNKLFELYLNGPPKGAQEKACLFPLDERAAEYDPPAVKNSLGPVGDASKRFTLADLVEVGRIDEALTFGKAGFDISKVVSGPYAQETYEHADRYAKLLMDYGKTTEHGRALTLLRNSYGRDIGTHNCLV